MILFSRPAVAAQSSEAKRLVPDTARCAARPLPLSAVRLTGGPLKRAQDLNAEYLLKLEPDRMLAYFRMRAGLEPKAKPYGGWDGDGKNLTGHIAGHYLSAVSLMWAATGDPRFKERADYLVKELKEVQDRHGDGYLGALADGRAALCRGGPRRYPLGRLRPERPLVALVRAAQDLRRAARRLSLHGQPHRAWNWRSSSPAGPKASSPSSTTHRSRRCWGPSSAG